MPLRRSLFTVFCLAVFGMSPVIAQERVPFAEWDRISGRTSEIVRSTAQQAKSAGKDIKAISDETGKKTTVEYFSPAAIHTADVDAVKPATSAAIPLREKTPSRSVERRNASTKADSDGLRNAAFVSDLESTAETGIRTVAAAVNRFEDFLGTSPVTKQDNAATDPFVADTDQKISGTDSGPQSPGVTLEWVRHGGFNVGQECDVELIVRNTSQAVVRTVLAEAVIPANVEVVSSRPAAVEGSEMPTWTFGELQPGQSQSVMLKLIPKTREDVRLDAYVRLTGSTSSQFVVQEPMIGVAVSGPEKVEIGQQVGYIVRVSNPGTGLANNVVIQAAIPEGLEHRNGSLLNIEIGTLNPGESRQARLSLTAVQGGEHQLAVRVLADGGLSEQTVTSVVVAEPQLAITLTGPKEPHVGRSENYTLTVSNGGNVQSTNVRAKYMMPAGYMFVSANRGGKYVEIDNAVEWFVGTLQPNDGSDFTITMKAIETGEVAHKAGVISEHGQVTTCELILKVVGTAALEMKIAADHREPRVGEEIQWEVQIRNTGTREASNVGVSCELPAGFEFIAADGPTKYIAENGVLVFRSIPVIGAASDAKIVIRGLCTREGHQRLRLRVASDSVTEVLIGEESASVSK